MGKSYNLLYVEDVAASLGACFKYAHDNGFNMQMFFDMFAYSFVAREIEAGNPRYLAGYSGAELFGLILSNNEQYQITPFWDRDKYYWAGYSLAKYQHYSGLSFKQIARYISINDVLSLYGTLHEADITKFYSVIDDQI